MRGQRKAGLPCSWTTCRRLHQPPGCALFDGISSADTHHRIRAFEQPRLIDAGTAPHPCCSCAAHAGGARGPPVEPPRRAARSQVDRARVTSTAAPGTAAGCNYLYLHLHHQIKG